MNPKKDIHQKGLFSNAKALFLGILFGLVIAELSLRLFVAYWPNPAHERNFLSFVKDVEAQLSEAPIYRDHPDYELRWELIPGSLRKFIRINAGGFRGKEYPKEASPGMVRIAVLGDSEAFGADLKEHETFPKSLEHSLNRITGYEKFEVLNFGTPGFNTSQEYRLLNTKVLAYNPSIVILYYVLNDPLGIAKTNLMERKLWVRSYLFLLIQYAKQISNAKKYNPEQTVRLYRQLHASINFQSTADLIRSMGNQLHERQIRFVVVIAPEISNFDDFKNYPFYDIHDNLKKLISEKIEVIDPLESLIALKVRPYDLWVLPNDCHKNSKANEAIADYVAKYLVKSKAG